MQNFFKGIMPETNKITALSLVEVAISFAILALVLAGIINLFGQAFVQGGKTKNELIALSLAAEKLEECVDYDDIANQTGSEDYGNITNFEGYKRVTNVTNFTYNELKRIEVTVFWQNDTKNISLLTLKGHY